MLKKLNKLYCIIFHQYFSNIGTARENGWHICAECYTPLSPITGDKINYEPEHD